MRRTRLPLAFVVLLLLVPLALADHAYTHRYVVFGRFVDANGTHIPGSTITMAATPGFRIEGPCSNQPGTETDAFGPTRTNAVANAYGEFMICVHVHTLDRNTTEELSFEVQGTGATAIVPVDPLFRQNFVLLESPGTSGESPPDRVHTVVGRAWRANNSPIVVDSIRVYGDTVQGAPVQVTIPGQRTVNTTTNNYGDFAVRIPLGPLDPAPSGHVEVRVNGTLFRAPIDNKSGVTYVRAALPALDEPGIPLPTPTPPRGTATIVPTTSTPGSTSATPEPGTAVRGNDSEGGNDAPLPWALLAVAATAIAVVLRRR